MTSNPERDAQAERMMVEYDELRLRLQRMERELSRECVEYGRRRGVWGYRIDHLRIALLRQQEQNGKVG